MNTDLIRSTLSQLQEVGRHAVTPEQHEALENSRRILYFIMGRGETGGFTDYFKSFNTVPLSPALSFATKEDADAWLRDHPAPPHGATIGAGDALYTLVYSREAEHRKLLILPSKEEWAQMEEAGDGAEEAVDEEPSAPGSGLGTRFKFFDFFKWTAFHLHELEPRISAPEQLEAIRVAKIAFHFVMHSGEDHGFEEYQETLHASRLPQPRQSFATQEEADRWLVKQPEPPPPTVVAIGSELYSVGYNRLRRLRMMIRIPAQQELDGAAGTARAKSIL